MSGGRRFPSCGADDGERESELGKGKGSLNTTSEVGWGESMLRPSAAKRGRERERRDLLSSSCKQKLVRKYNVMYYDGLRRHTHIWAGRKAV